MTEIATRPATPAETEEWLSDWSARRIAEYAKTGQQEMAERGVKRFREAPDATVLRLLFEDEPAGYMALSTVQDYGSTTASLDDVLVDERLRGRGIGAAAVRYAEEWARSRSSRIRAHTVDDPAQRALVRGWVLGGQSMVKALSPSGLELPPGVSVRPLSQADYDVWYPRLVEEYGQSFVDAGLLTPEEAQQRAVEQTASILPDGLATADHEFIGLLDHGELAGQLWLHHGARPGESFVYDVEVFTEQRGKGFGKAIMIAGEAASLAAGSERLGLHVFGHNTVAIGLYERLDYQVVNQNWTLTLS